MDQPASEDGATSGGVPPDAGRLGRRRADAPADRSGNETSTLDSVDEGTVPAEEPTGGKRKDPRRRGFVRRHWVATAVTAVLALVVTVAGAGYAYYWYVNQAFDQIARLPAGITKTPPPGRSEGNSALDILLVGVDNGNNGDSIASDLNDGTWTVGAHRTDTIMLVHIPANRESITLVSIPRDTWISMPECHKYALYLEGCRAKINAAFSLGGPKLMVRTIQNFTGISLDHFAAVDWNGFKDLTTKLGGIRVYIPQAFYDTSQRYEWHAGWQKLAGDVALKYVRTRYNLPDGSSDFGRMARQQNFLRATMNQLLSSDVRYHPLKLLDIVKVIAKYLAVDQGWSTDEIRSLALSMHNVASKDVTFLTLQTTSAKSAGGQDIQLAKHRMTRQLFKAFAAGRISTFVKRHPTAVRQLASTKGVS